MDSKTNNRNYNLLILTIFFCSILIILSNYVFSKQVAVEVNKMRIENEYSTIGGEDNYMILKQLQKEEMVAYIDKLKEEKPEYVEQLRKKAMKGSEVITSESGNEAGMKLSKEVLDSIKENTSIKGSSGALITLIEYSDLECPYCSEFHNNKIAEKVLDSNSGSLNYIYKHFPLPKHENAKKLALGAKCTEKIGGAGEHFDFVDYVFKNNTPLDDLAEVASKVGVDKEDFISCYNENKYIGDIEKEFLEGVSLGITSTPSSVIINNETLEYKIIPGVVSVEKIEEEINNIIK